MALSCFFTNPVAAFSVIAFSFLQFFFFGPCLFLLNTLFSFWVQVWVSVDQMHHCQENLAIMDSADSDFEELPLAVKTFIDLVQIPQGCGRLCACNGMAKCT